MKTNYIECIDCVEGLKSLPYGCIDLIVTSPPYNMTKRKGGYADTGRYDVYNDWKPESEYIDWMVSLFESFDVILKNNGVVLFNLSYSVENPALPFKVVSSVCDRTPFYLVDTIIWKKKCGLPFPANSRRLSRICEFIFVFCRQSDVDTFNTNRNLKSISSKTGQKYYEVIYNFIEARNNDGKCKQNQATYSSELCEKLINIYSKSKDDIILDPFMGSGTTAIACLHTDRHYIGFEISEEYCKIAEERVKETRKGGD